MGWFLSRDAEPTLWPLPKIIRPSQSGQSAVELPTMKAYSALQDEAALSSNENITATYSGTNSGLPGSGVVFVPTKVQNQSLPTLTTVPELKLSTVTPELLTLPPPGKTIPLKDPSIYQVLPFLKNESSLLPAFISSKGRKGGKCSYQWFFSFSSCLK